MDIFNYIGYFDIMEYLKVWAIDAHTESDYEDYELARSFIRTLIEIRNS